MPSLRPLAAAAGVLSVALLALAPTQTGSPPADGDPVGQLTFKDIRYLPRTLDELGEGRRATVLVFTTTTCPVAARYLPRLKELSRTYADKGVAFAAVNVGLEDSIQDMALQAMDHGITFPVLKDPGNASARALGITRTPEVIVLDADHILRYRGRVDSQYRLTGASPNAGRQDLAEAIEDVLAGRKVRVPETPVDGCAITFPAPLPPSSDLTYARDIAPIIARHCADCHRPGAEAPFPLASYEDAASRAEMISEVVAEGRMPPWFAHPDFGTFENERRLTPEERSKVIAWAASGAKPGDLSTLPPAAPAAVSTWTMGEPDLVVSALWPETLPADGFIPYRYVILPYVFTHDTWVQGIEIMPGNARVVHHANLGFLKVGERFDPGRNFLTGRVPGGTAMDLKDGMALLIPAGSIIGVQVHYVTTGKPETDRISVGLRFAKEPVQKQVHYLRLANLRINIPPGAPAHEVSAARKLPGDATLLGLFNHMHLRGKDTSFIAHLPNNTSEKLLVVPNYSFDWQISYRYAAGAKKLPGGTRIECISHFDNSPFNPFNPDPTATVRTGPQTHDEMMEAFVFYTLDDEQLDLKVDPATGQQIREPAE